MSYEKQLPKKGDTVYTTDGTRIYESTLKGDGMMTAEVLEACPFCREKAAATRSIKKSATTNRGRNGNHVYRVVCLSCLAGTGWQETEKEAIRKWNMWRGVADG